MPGGSARVISSNKEWRSRGEGRWMGTDRSAGRSEGGDLPNNGRQEQHKKHDQHRTGPSSLVCCKAPHGTTQSRPRPTAVISAGVPYGHCREMPSLPPLLSPSVPLRHPPLPSPRPACALQRNRTELGTSALLSNTKSCQTTICLDRTVLNFLIHSTSFRMKSVFSIYYLLL